MFDSERNKQHQRVLCNEVRRLPNETIKQLAVRIETLVRKAYSLNTHVYKNTKMTEVLMMTLTPQLRRIAFKKRASYPSSIREPDSGFRKLDFWRNPAFPCSHSNNGTEQTPMSKPFKQTFHITDIKHNIFGIPFFTKYIPTMNILNSRIHIKNKYTRMKNTALTFFKE